MPLSQEKFHESVFQLLFALDVGGEQKKELVSFLMNELKVTEKQMQLAFQKTQAVFEKRQYLDQIIGSTSQAYALERIGKVERNILRLAFYELLYESQVSSAKIIKEALRLTTKFSTKQAAAFVNAILDDHDRAALLSCLEKTVK